MDALKAIKTRRSIRKYVKKTVTKDTVKELLEVGMSAPSAGNEQPWHFIVIDDPEILGKIPAFHNHAQMLKDAAVAILVCGDMNLDEHEGMWVQDCAAATENILVAVNAIGLGAVWLGIYPRQQRMDGLRNLLNIPDNVVPFSLISIGYPGEHKEPSSRYSEERVHYNKW